MEIQRGLLIDAEAVRSRRLAVPWSRQELAAESGVHENTIEAIELAEDGRKPIYPKTVRKLAAAFKCETADLLVATEPEEVAS